MIEVLSELMSAVINKGFEKKVMTPNIRVHNLAWDASPKYMALSVFGESFLALPEKKLGIPELQPYTHMHTQFYTHSVNHHTLGELRYSLESNFTTFLLSLC